MHIYQYYAMSVPLTKIITNVLIKKNGFISTVFKFESRPEPTRNEQKLKTLTRYSIFFLYKENLLIINIFCQ